MNWTELTDQAQLDAIDAASVERPILILKHSTRCSISSAALARLERRWSPTDDTEHPAYYLDLLRHRALSNSIAERYRVPHESPQVLVIRNGRCSRSMSHFGITYDATLEALKQNAA